MRTQKNIGIALALLGFFSMVILLALNIAGGSMERDSALLCGSCLAVCGAGFSLAVGGERSLLFVPHSLFPVLCAAAAILVHELDELFMPLLLLVLLGCASVCIYGRERAHIIFSAVYVGLGGAGALLSKCIKEAEVVAYDDLGTEAIRRLRVENLPVIVVIDSEGTNLYATAADQWKK